MAKGARFRMTGLDDFVARATAYPENLLTMGSAAAIDAAKLGAEVMERVIQSSGTGWEGRSGRVDSGQMLRDVGYTRSAERGSTGSGKATRTAEFGWTEGWLPYYEYQEKGFVNRYKSRENEGVTWGGTEYSGTGGPPGWTDGMSAYAQGYYEAQERFRANIESVTRKAWYKK